MTTLPGLEGITLLRWITEQLSDDAALAVAIGVTVENLPDQMGEGVAPAESDPTKPWIVFTVIEPRDIKVVGGIQVMAQTQVQVRCTTKGDSYAPLIPVYQRVHTLLEGQRLQAPTGHDGLVLSCERVSGIQYPENAQGIQYRHLGGLYDTYVQ